jgi:DNA-binding Lrp family transcriptional regulator
VGLALSLSERNYTLDAIDHQVIAELMANSRISMRSLAQKIHISRAHAYVRIERLKAAGIITGFTTRIAHTKAGLPSSAYVALSIRQNSWQGLAASLKALPYVEHFSLLGGDFDVMVLVRAPHAGQLRHTVLEQLQALDGVLSTRTWIIFEEDTNRAAYFGPAD